MLEVTQKVIKEVGWVPALFLSQLSLWEKERGMVEEGKIWVTATQEEWADQLGVSRRTFSSAVSKLKHLGLISTASLAKHQYDRTLSYARTEKGVSSATV